MAGAGEVSGTRLAVIRFTNRVEISSLLTFDNFPEQLTYLALGRFQRPLAERGSPINLSQRFAVPFFGRTQVTLFLQSVQERVKASGANSITVTRQFLDHAKAEDRLFGSVMQDVKPDEARIKITIAPDRLARFSFSSLSLYDHAPRLGISGASICPKGKNSQQ